MRELDRLRDGDLDRGVPERDQSTRRIVKGAIPALASAPYLTKVCLNLGASCARFILDKLKLTYCSVTVTLADALESAKLIAVTVSVDAWPDAGAL